MLKVIRVKLFFKVSAIIDIITAEKFELITIENGKIVRKVRYCKKEIENLK